MPTYDFRCPAGHDFERFFGKISDSPSEVECPSCGAMATRQISGGAGLLFKGSGFYITDYGKDGKKDQKGAAKAAAKPDAGATGESGGSAKAEGGAKPESSSGPKSDAAPAKPAAPSKPAGGE